MLLVPIRRYHKVGNSDYHRNIANGYHEYNQKCSPRQRSGAAASCLLSAKGREILEGLYENQNNNLHENCNGPHNTVINDAREQHYPNKKK